MSSLLRKRDVVGHFGGSYAAVARAFQETTHGRALSRVAVRNWPDVVPELRARQLVEGFPDLRAFLLDPITMLTASEMRERLTTKAR